MECYPSTTLEMQTSDECKESCVINRETVLLIIGTGGNHPTRRLNRDTRVQWWKWIPENVHNMIFVNVCDNPTVKGFVDKRAISDWITMSDSDDDSDDDTNDKNAAVITPTHVTRPTKRSHDNDDSSDGNTTTKRKKRKTAKGI